jgi:hypothetical protein
VLSSETMGGYLNQVFTIPPLKCVDIGCVLS